MSCNKRRHQESEPSASTSSTKRARRHSDTEPIVIDVDDDNLDVILARIKEQEASEALAKQLQDEWNGTSNSEGTSSRDAIVIDGDEVEVEYDEDDASMARRLAQEWGDSDVLSIASQVSTRETSHPGLSATSSSEEEDPPDKILDHFRELFTADRNCSKCGKLVSSPRGHVMFSGETTPPPSLLMLLHAPCSSCRTNHCRGCFKPIPCGISCKGSSKTGDCGVQTCCAEGRAIAIFETLGGFDRQYLGEQATSESRAQAALAKRKPTTANSVGPGGTGYGNGRGGGRGRARGQATTSRPSKADQLAAHFEHIIIRVLNTLTTFLPAPYADSAQVYDMLPHASIGHLLALSQLPQLLGRLLRNDSVTDWIARSETYQAMLSLLRRMADCELTVQILIRKRWEMTKSCGIEEWMWGDGEITWEMNEEGTIERAPPLYDHFKKLTRQCEAFLAGASQMIDAPQNELEDGANDIDETMVAAMSLCGDMIAARDDIEKAMIVLSKGFSSSSTGEGSTSHPTISSSQRKGKGHDEGVDMEKLYAQECERLAFAHVMLADAEDLISSKGKNKSSGSGLSYASHYFSKDLEQTQSATRNPRNRFHLAKELAVMATSLPPGVWVRVDEVRNDAIKIMIAGPEGTPYAGGLFEFDCFMPIEYPNSPPKVYLRTTGGGSVRFNPNLYANGKVCLSLLGTWPGRPEEQWSPKSTLLQVLVSIQSMILVDVPYFNEPGFGKANPNAPASIAYNVEVSLQTVRWAMIEWMKDKYRHGLWRDVIASHFSIRNSKIRKTILEWAAKDPRIRGQPRTTYGGALSRGVPVLERPNGESTSIDLLDEYDKGIERIQTWVS